MFVYVLEYEWQDSRGVWTPTVDVYENRKDAERKSVAPIDLAATRLL